MLSLRNITKNYKVGNSVVKALRGVSVNFRQNEFVSILGPSGCGKTTLLNIIGGLDHYTSGDLIINGKSTEDFKDKDWDTYRNHRIGFVFQSYNLIPHQSVLANVELALTLSGVSKSQRRKRAAEVLEMVGLGDQLHKRPNQMSGGQMQRVAIARALVNNPDILLADEPTGALDSETSVQIMELLKEVSKDRLVIMVTHNPELAEKYSTRIINLLDGTVTDDSMPYEDEPVFQEREKRKLKSEKGKKKNTSMSFFTALSLSFNNLRTKKGRTFLISFAGSIGIIGIALILSLSSGIQLYIESVQRETLTSYPLQIVDETNDMSSMMSAFIGLKQNEGATVDQAVKSNNIMGDVLDAMVGGTTENNLTAFKKYIESKNCNIDKYVSDIAYKYSTVLNIYCSDTSKGLKKVNPSTVYSDLGFNTSYTTDDSTVSLGGMSAMNQTDVWMQLSNKKDVLETSYNVLEGRLPQKYNEAVIVLDKNGHISDYTLYSLGLMDEDKLIDNLKKSSNGKDTEKIDTKKFSFKKLMSQKYKLLINTDYYSKNSDGTWEDHTEDEPYIINKLKNALKIKVVGIVQAEDSNTEVSQFGGVGYRSDLIEYLVKKVNNSSIVKQQKNHKKTDVFTGIKFLDDEEKDKKLTIDDVYAYIETLDDSTKQQYSFYIQQMQQSGMSDDEIAKAFEGSVEKQTTDNTYDGNMEILGVANLNSPSEIDIYPVDFESKDNIEEIITGYNDDVKEADKISYTDYIGIMMDSVTTMINAVSYALIGFVSISLIVSSIMIGIITYISVLERTKEIGILRAIGARKRDVSRVFNAETMIIGFAAGLIGIGVTVLLNIPINILIEYLTEISGVAVLPWAGAVILVIISMILTFIAGLVPARIAAKKDPVVALRNE